MHAHAHDDEPRPVWHPQSDADPFPGRHAVTGWDLDADRRARANADAGRLPDDNLAYSPARIPDSLGDPLAQPRADVVRLPARDADGYTLAERRAQHARAVTVGDRDSAGIYASHVRAHPDHPSRRRSD